MRRFAIAACLLFAASNLLAQGPAPSAAPSVAQVAAAPAPVLTLEEQEEFLKKAKVIRTKGSSKGVTGTSVATLSDGRITHDASIQSIDEFKQKFQSDRGVEFNFRDCWCYNVAAYRLDRLLDLKMIPPSVERTYNSKKSAFTWWVDEVLMDEGARLKEKHTSPDAQAWNEQMWHVRMFDQLIHNVDRNLGNLLIDRGWQIWMIDHTRAFRVLNKLQTPGNLTKIDRELLERLKALDKPTLTKALKDYLTAYEINALLARRDAIVEHFEKKGPSGVFEWQRRRVAVTTAQ